MATLNQLAKLSFVFACLSAIPVVMAFSESAGQEKAQAAQKVTTDPPPQDESSADKKDEPVHPLQKFMRQKLHASNAILEGLCTEDLKMVAEGSETLMKMSREEQWRVSNDIMYKRYSREFINSVEELQTEAEDNDMDGTSMAWVNVTMKCLKCHEWVRNAVLADADK